MVLRTVEKSSARQGAARRELRTRHVVAFDAILAGWGTESLLPTDSCPRAGQQYEQGPTLSFRSARTAGRRDVLWFVGQHTNGSSNPLRALWLTP